MLEKIMIMLNASGDRAAQVVNYLIDDCTEFALSYTNLTELPAKLEPTVTAMVIEKYNKMGAEGVTGRSYSGLSESYADDFSPSIYKQLNKCRKIKLL